MEAFFILLAIGYLFVPIIALIIAIVANRGVRQLLQSQQSQAEKIKGLEHELRELRQLLRTAKQAGNLADTAHQASTTQQAENAASATASIIALDASPAPTTRIDADLTLELNAAAEAAPASTPEPERLAELSELSISNIAEHIPSGQPANSSQPLLTLPAIAEISPTQNPVAEALPSSPSEASAAPHTTPASAASKPPIPPAPAPAPAPAAPASPPQPNWFSIAREWLFGGNLVAKMGLLILFFGISFLLKYASERVSVPIELRLAGIVLADIAMLLWGWRIRLSRPGIALPVQGAAMAIMMLVTFAAMRMYQLIPPELAFFLLLALTAFTCILAVLQNALWLALFGITGGFMVPIATSTGQGSHIALFSYYLLLNGGILGIALKRSWRALNLVGLAFTFVIGTAWGVLRYKQEFYLSTQGFLLAFFLFYLAIALLYARRQPPNLKGLVDGTLVFGTPMLAFGLQYGLVKDFEYGLAFSALALSLLYATLGSLIWQRSKADSSYRLLVESLLALAVVFGTLAIPLALDGRWTSAAWALEGAGIVWLGLRQQRPLTWGFGLVVQVAAWGSFLLTAGNMDSVEAKSQNLWLGFLLLAGACFMMACTFRSTSQKDDQANNQRFGWPATIFLAVATLWLTAGAWVEVFLRLSDAALANLLVVSALIICAMLAFIAQKMLWPVARNFAVGLMFFTGLILFGVMLEENLFAPKNSSFFDGPFLSSVLMSLGAAVSSFVLSRAELKRPWPAHLMLISASFFWFFPALVGLMQAVEPYWPEFIWGTISLNSVIIYPLCVALSSALLVHIAGKLKWPQLRWTALFNCFILLCLAAGTIFEANLFGDIPPLHIWLGLAFCWLGNEAMMALWARWQWTFKPLVLRFLHCLRVVTPWALVWPLGHYWLNQWLNTEADTAELLAAAGWFTSGSWSRFIPAWGMLAILGALVSRSAQASTQAKLWPVSPITGWYLQSLLPLGIAWSLYLALYWNLTQNGAMAPLPYLPLLNPLDLTTAFAILLLVFYQRASRDYVRLNTGAEDNPQKNLPLLARPQPKWLQLIGIGALYFWLNLILLRSLAHYAQIPYQFDAMFDAQLVQVTLALVWSASALIFMRYAVKQVRRDVWLLGAALLGLVVLKLFMLDLSRAGSIERIVSFVGVGILMLGIGYLAPFPASSSNSESTRPE